ncbi:MAG: glycosyltransferase family protein [bacterium]|nr:glycosyltransferase family protein [bacterium]
MVEKKPKISAIIQARMGSTRLPGKVLMEICGKPVLGHIVERLRFSKLIDQIILAVPDTKENDALEAFAAKNSIACYRGSENDVLERMYLAAQENGCAVVVEVTGDKPLIDPKLIDVAISRHLNVKSKHSFTYYPSDFLPIGLDAGIINVEALQLAYKNATKERNREHVTSYFYENSDKFALTSFQLPLHLKNPGLRLTLDTKEDFELINAIYVKLYKEGDIFTTKEILDLCKARPELKKINAHVIQKTIHA